MNNSFNKFYNTKGPFNIAQIQEFLSINCIPPKVSNDDPKDVLIYNINTIKNAAQTDIVVLSNKKYYAQLQNTKAKACIVNSQEDAIDHCWSFVSPNSYYDYCKLVNFFYSEKETDFNLQTNGKYYYHSSAKIGKNSIIGYNVVIEENVKIGNNCFIDSGVVIKANCEIGDNAKIGANVYISYCNIGNNVVILPGAKIGQDGFGFATNKGIHHKILHIGRVIIGNDVEIGANTTIDRGSLQDTVISDLCKIDNLVQLGHNVYLGKGCLVVAQAGVAGSAVIGNYCALGGQVGVSGHVKLADRVQIAAQGGVAQSITQEGTIMGGSPCVPIRDWHKQSVILKQMVKKGIKYI